MVGTQNDYNITFILRLFKLYSRKDSIIAYLKISFSKNLNHRNSQMTCKENQFTVFSMLRVFSGRRFQIGYAVVKTVSFICFKT